MSAIKWTTNDSSADVSLQWIHHFEKYDNIAYYVPFVLLAILALNALFALLTDLGYVARLACVAHVARLAQLDCLWPLARIFPALYRVQHTEACFQYLLGFLACRDI